MATFDLASGHSYEKLSENFSDRDVGCVTVDIDFVIAVGGGVQKGQGALWKYERFLRSRSAAGWYRNRGQVVLAMPSGDHCTENCLLKLLKTWGRH